MTKLKTKLTPLQNFKISFNKNIYKNIKPNNNTIIKNLTILPTIHLKYINHYFILKQKKKIKDKYQTKQQKKFMIHTHDKNLTILNDFHTQEKKKKTKEKYKTKQQKKFMIHAHDKFINYIFYYFILFSTK